MNQPSIFPWEDDARQDATGEQDMFDDTPAGDYHPPATPDSAAKQDPNAGQDAAAKPASQARPASLSMAPTAVDLAANDEIGAPFASRDRSQPRARIARKEYYSIGEVSELVGLPAHVLRYWEAQFPVLNPSKNRSGNRAYQRKEIRLILLVKQLLYEDKYTIEGAKARLDQLRKGGSLPATANAALDRELIDMLRQDVAELRRALSGSAN
ncbi:MAG TPA: MerR family transcriptional regulator [Longimicrobiales bacterium]